MFDPIQHDCPHCLAKAGEPCHSVGGRPIADPHMRRLDGRVDQDVDPGYLRARAAYARSVCVLLFGYHSPELVADARKARAIDVAARWAQKYLRAPRAPVAEYTP